MKDSD